MDVPEMVRRRQAARRRQPPGMSYCLVGRLVATNGKRGSQAGAKEAYKMLLAGADRGGT